MKSRVGIIGSTGYTGVVLTKLLLEHPNVQITLLTSEQHSGKYYYEVYPSFYEKTNLKCTKFSINNIARLCDIVFFATPNDFASTYAPKLLSKNKNIKIIDLSADFRLKTKLKIKNNITNIAYGLPELHRNEIKNSSLIANPGCYPTSILLGLTPALKKKIIHEDSIVCDSKSGVTGAGKGVKQELHFTEINESFTAYKLGGTHRHISEIENEISKLLPNKRSIKITFSPHLLPINRGILSTIYADLKSKKISQNDIYRLYKNYYKNECFIKVLPHTIYAQTKNVRYTNFCHITPIIDKRTNKLIVISAIDNMVKGASGQAVQNMNIILSLKESVGLDSLAQIP